MPLPPRPSSSPANAGARRALRAYAEVGFDTLPQREIEAEAWRQASRLLLQAQQTPDDSHQLAVALRFNRTLWAIAQRALTAADCPLPPALRRNLLRLVRHVERQTAALTASPQPTRLAALARINDKIAEGLAHTDVVG